MELIKGHKYTLIYVGEMSAMTHKIEVTFESQDRKERCNSSGSIPRLWFKQRGKRKLNGLVMNAAFLVFHGWDIPLRVDTECSSFRGNACLNFVGEIDEIRDYIDAHNLNEDANKGVVLCVGDTIADKEEVVYPELAKDLSHAVIRRIMQAA